MNINNDVDQHISLSEAHYITCTGDNVKTILQCKICDFIVFSITFW